jgi:hypothetical protein
MMDFLILWIWWDKLITLPVALYLFMLGVAWSDWEGVQ